jgi:biopolymer transport protein ExbD
VSAQSTSLLGYGLYFIDVLACLLFCVTLALVGARFGREHTVPVELPRAPETAGSGSDLAGVAIAIRTEGAEPAIYLESERVSLSELEERLNRAPPPSVVVRSEASTLARVIAIAHAAGVLDIELAYEAESRKEER